jgi:hypothetical protein
MRPNFPSQMAHRFAAPLRRDWGLLSIFASCGLAWVTLGEHFLLTVALFALSKGLSYGKRAPDRKDLSSAVFNVRRTSPFVASAVQPWPF